MELRPAVNERGPVSHKSSKSRFKSGREIWYLIWYQICTNSGTRSGKKMVLYEAVSRRFLISQYVCEGCFHEKTVWGETNAEQRPQKVTRMSNNSRRELSPLAQPRWHLEFTSWANYDLANQPEYLTSVMWSLSPRLYVCLALGMTHLTLPAYS